MIDLLREMFATPGTPLDAYGRMSAATGHAMIGAVLCAVILAMPVQPRPWRAAVSAASIYAVFWEGGQMVWSASTLADGAIDAAAVLCGALIAACLWARRLPPILPIVLALLVLGQATPKSGRDPHE